MHVERAVHQRVDVVIADTEHRRIQIAADAHDDAAHGGPPHPMDRKFVEQVFDTIKDDRHQPRLQARNNAEEGAQPETPPRDHRGDPIGKERSRAEHPRPPHSSNHRGRNDRNETAWLPFEKKKFDGEKNRRDRGAENAGHAGCGARDEQRFALGGAHMEKLREQRAERAAGHDDRAFRAERPAGSDGDRRRQRLQHRHLRLDSALAEQDRLDGFGNAVAANLLRAEARHQSDNEAADDGNEDGPER